MLCAKQKGCAWQGLSWKRKEKTDVPKATKGDVRLAATARDFGFSTECTNSSQGSSLKMQIPAQGWGLGFCISNKLPCGVGAAETGAGAIHCPSNNLPVIVTPATQLSKRFSWRQAAYSVFPWWVPKLLAQHGANRRLFAEVLTV